MAKCFGLTFNTGVLNPQPDSTFLLVVSCCLTKNGYLIWENILLILSVFGSNHYCEQLFIEIKNFKSRSKNRYTNEHLEGSTRIAAAEVKSDT